MPWAIIAAVLLFVAILVEEWHTNKKGAGEEHRFTATASCMNGRHHMCSGRVHYFTKRGTTPCTCPHHKEE